MARGGRFRLALGLACGASLAFLVFLLARPVGDGSVKLTANLAQLLAPTLAAAVCVWAAATASGRNRRAWALLAASAGSWAVGQATWVWYELERMTFFSDAVIAIALTLLALELPVPEADGPRTLLRALTGAHGRQYLAFLLAFVLVGASWLAHHALVSYVAGSDDRLLVLNLVALFGFVLVPWASETLGTAAAGGVGLAVFSAVMTVLAASTLALARHVGRAGLLRPGTPDAVLGRVGVLTGVQSAMVGAQEAGGTDEVAGASATSGSGGSAPSRRSPRAATMAARRAADRRGTNDGWHGRPGFWGASGGAGSPRMTR